MTLLVKGDYVKCITIATDRLLDENISITNHPWDRSILRTDGWVTRGEETAISILPQEQLTTILLFWETVIVI